MAHRTAGGRPNAGYVACWNHAVDPELPCVSPRQNLVARCNGPDVSGWVSWLMAAVSRVHASVRVTVCPFVRVRFTRRASSRKP